MQLIQYNPYQVLQVNTFRSLSPEHDALFAHIPQDTFPAASGLNATDGQRP